MRDRRHGKARRRAVSEAAAVAVVLLGTSLLACRPAGETSTATGDATAAPAAAEAGRPRAGDSAAPETARPALPGAGGGAAAPPVPPPSRVRDLVPRVVASYPHDPGSYTQGLELAGPVLYESAGGYGTSSVRRVDLETGRVLLERELTSTLFAEGLTSVPAAHGHPAQLVQLTWREGRALLWDPAALEPAGEHAYEGEGWGLCFDGDAPGGPRLVMGDGSSYLTFRDPASFAVTGGVPVTLGGAPLGGLNELECVGGSAWANVYPTDRIVEVDLATGRVLATVDASGLLAPGEAPGAEVLNGIAHDPADGTFLLTGKLWPRLFRVELVER